MPKRKPYPRPAKPKESGAHLKTIEGIIQVTARGVGYMPYEGHDDIEMPKEELGTALHGDHVAVKLTGLFPRPRGKVTKVVKRKREEFVGTLAQDAAGGFVVVPDDRRFYAPIRIPNGEALRLDVKVLVRLTAWEPGKAPQGIVVSILGEKGAHRVEMNSIVMEHGFRTDFTEDVEREAQQIEQAH